MVSVRELVIARLADPKAHPEAKFGLSIEGGGMRGVVSGAMLVALAQLRIDRILNGIYGTSSGAVNGAYFATGSTWEALSVYYDYLPRGFLKRSSRTLWLPKLEMDYLFETVMTETVPLDIDRLRSLQIPVMATISLLEDAVGEVVDLRHVDDPIAVLRAGSWLPLLSGPLPTLDGKAVLDGGTFKPDPLYAAIEDGCTHVLALNTRPRSARGHSGISRQLTKHLLNSWSPSSGNEYLRLRRKWDRDKLSLPQGATDFMGAQVLRLAPGRGSHSVGRTTVDLGLLIQAARAGYDEVLRELSCGEFDGSLISIVPKKS